MMRAVLFLCLVGAAIYGFLVITDGELSGGKRDALTVTSRSSHSENELLSSWGSYLPSHSRNQNSQLATLEQPAALSPQQRHDPSQNLRAETTEKLAAGDKGTNSESASAKPAPVKVATESTNEPPVAKTPLPKSNKRHRSAKPAVRALDSVVVANAQPWNGRWDRRAERRRGFGLFMFRPVPRFMAQGR
jgi:hypothetical protein